MNQMLRALALVISALPVGLVACGGGDGTTGTWGNNTGCSAAGLSADSVCAGGTTVKGVDISHYDGTVSFTQLKGGGYDFAIAKATEGTSYVDPTFAGNWAAMKQAGVVRGAYHFFHSNMDGATQAQHLLDTIKSAGGLQPGDLPPVADVEVTDSQSPATQQSVLATFLQAVKAGTGMTPIIYTSPSFASTNLGTGFGQYTLWIANWQVTCPSLPAPWTTWDFWQDSSTATVPGISGQVDTDEFNGSLTQLMGLGGGTGSTGGDAGSGSGGGDAGTGSGSGSGSGSSSGSGSGGSDGGSSSGSSGSSSSGGGDGTPHAGGSSGGDAGPCGP